MVWKAVISDKNMHLFYNFFVYMEFQVRGTTLGAWQDKYMSLAKGKNKQIENKYFSPRLAAIYHVGKKTRFVTCNIIKYIEITLRPLSYPKPEF